MFGHRDMEVQDYLAMLRRRVWWIVVPLLLSPVIGYGVSRVLPEEYTSRTLILVEGQKVPDNYVKSTLNDDLLQRLAAMQEQILSRTRLQPLIERFGLYKQDQGKLSMEELLERMRKNITVSAVQATLGSSDKEKLPGFYISFTSDNPRIAQQVCAELTSMFITENLKTREQSAQGTTEFLSKQLEDSKRRLDELDKQLAEFKGKNLGALPGQEQTNMSLLMGMNTQLDAITQALSRLQQDKLMAENILAQQLQAWEAGEGSASPQTLEQQLTAAQAQLTVLESRYTEKHPDVIKAREAVASLRKKIGASGSPATETTQKRGGLEPQNIQQLRITLHNMEQSIKERQSQQARLQSQIAVYQGRVAASPMIEEQAKALMRDYEIAHKFYNDLLAKKTLSEMATDMERRQQGENFRVMDPASLPEKPSFPDRQLFTIAGGVAGLALGIGLALLIELRDKSLRTESDVEFYLELPTLAAMPTIGNGNGTRRRFWQRGKKDAAAGKKGTPRVEQGVGA